MPPFGQIPDILDFLPDGEIAHSELRSTMAYFLGKYCRRAGLRIYTSILSLVHHREVRSPLGHRACYGHASGSFTRHYGPMEPA